MHVLLTILYCFQGKESDIIQSWTIYERKRLIKKIAANTRTHVTNNPYRCVIWKGRKNVKGYPRLSVTIQALPSVQVYVHRFVYMLKYTQHECIQGLDVSHLCHNKLCVNHHHLIIETKAENNKRKECLTLGRCNSHSNGFQCLL